MRAPIAAQQSGDLRLGRPGRYLGLDLFQLRVGFGLQLLIAVLELLGRGLKLLIGTADLAVLRLHLVKLLFELLDQFAVSGAVRPQLAQLALDFLERLGLRLSFIRQRPGRSGQRSYRDDHRRKSDHRHNSSSGFRRRHEFPLLYYERIESRAAPRLSNERAR